MAEGKREEYESSVVCLARWGVACSAAALEAVVSFTSNFLLLLFQTAKQQCLKPKNVKFYPMNFSPFTAVNDGHCFFVCFSFFFANVCVSIDWFMRGEG